MKKVVVLGAGRVARPCVQYLLEHGYEVYAADISAENIDRCLGGHPNGHAIVGDAMGKLPQILEELKPDLLICLLPREFMIPAADECVKAGVHYVNPSYVKEGMRALDNSAQAKGLVLLCELGLDPGIDHMSAVKAIEEAHSKGGKVTSFVSLCGALPAPKDNNNPISYKLSWAPSSLIGASRREARIIKDGEVIIWPDGETYHNAWFVEIQDMGWYEAYANADSTPYVEYYGIPEATEVYRGTLRYVGWCEMICKMQDLGLCSEDKVDFTGMTYADVTRKLVGITKDSCIRRAVSDFLKMDINSTVMLKFEWLGLFDDKPVPISSGTMNQFVECLYSEKLEFAEGEEDMSLMEHRFIIEYPDRKVLKRSTLVDFGSSDKDFSIARLTGLPPAMGAHLILEGKIMKKGVLTPAMPEVYEPELSALEKMGVVFKESETEIN
ncbi:MAG: saccharopine dehydrogenase C-terminal domain-containing protein [Synergistaceae bacterium]|jgi:saccharopine dehydrogenase-like NADP-dependent oxidoreductase|nr:saccharopine dehydrogenase NADP-binding domain-containing protein [Candidatus Cloacimonadota bacterium]